MKCFEDTRKSRTTSRTSKNASPAAPGQIEPDQPRVAWHGEYFRERFLEKQLPLLFGALPADAPACLQVALFGLIDAEPGVEGWFVKQRKIKDPEVEWEEEDDVLEGDDDKYWGYSYVPKEIIWRDIQAMSQEEALRWLKECSLHVLLHKASADVRRMVGEHIGIDLAKEWRITKEYLDKKTTKEIHAIAEEFKLWERKEAQAFLFEALNKKRGNFKSCKKDELVRIFLESGMDLAGVVPKEILATDSHRQNQTEEDEGGEG